MLLKDHSKSVNSMHSSVGAFIAQSVSLMTSHCKDYSNYVSETIVGHCKDSQKLFGGIDIQSALSSLKVSHSC